MALLAGFLAAGPVQAETELYAKRDRLVETMAATRARLQEWRKGQEEARRSVHIAPWQTLKVRAGEEGRAGLAPATAAVGGKERLFDH